MEFRRLIALPENSLTVAARIQAASNDFSKEWFQRVTDPPYNEARPPAVIPVEKFTLLAKKPHKRERADGRHRDQRFSLHTRPEKSHLAKSF